MNLDDEVCRLVFQLKCRHGITRTHQLTFQECESLQVVYLICFVRFAQKAFFITHRIIPIFHFICFNWGLQYLIRLECLPM